MGRFRQLECARKHLLFFFFAAQQSFGKLSIPPSGYRELLEHDLHCVLVLSGKVCTAIRLQVFGPFNESDSDIQNEREGHNY